MAKLPRGGRKSPPKDDDGFSKLADFIIHGTPHKEDGVKVIRQYFADIATGKLRARPRVSLSADEELLLKVSLLWERHPELGLRYKYGNDLLTTDGFSYTIPDDPEEVYKWSWDKVQQFSAHVLNRDPGEDESAIVRAHLAGYVRSRHVDRLKAARHSREVSHQSAVPVPPSKPKVAEPPAPSPAPRVAIIKLRRK